MPKHDNEKSHPKYSIANMAGLKTAIANGEVERVKELIGDQVLDELQKSYFIELAQLSNAPNIVKVLENTPSRS